MTFKDLKKRIGTQTQEGQQTTRLSELLAKLAGKLFWIWHQELHILEDLRRKGDCCFNHIVGLPVKDKVEHPLYDYEKILHHDSRIHLLTLTLLTIH